MNHVPDDVLAAVDDLGWAVLVDKPTTVDGRLRADFRVRIDCDRRALDAGTVPAAFRLEHGDSASTLQGHGSLVATIVKGVNAQPRGWGVKPPETYAHRETDDGWQVYAGHATLL
jgi:hypothetical protein